MFSSVVKLLMTMLAMVLVFERSVGVMPMEITYMDMEDEYKYMVLKIHIFKVHIFKLHILYLKMTKIHVSKSIEVSDFFIGLA